jgi:tetratricopeptide (TPR) repeat protein
MAKNEDGVLADLGRDFTRALELRGQGKTDEAAEILRRILSVEPRLAEPRMELGRIHLDAGRPADAEAEAKEAIAILERGGQWTEALPDHVVLSMAWSLLGAALQDQATADDVVFGQVERFTELIEQARVAFARAAELDPTDVASAGLAAELGDDDDEDPRGSEIGEA